MHRRLARIESIDLETGLFPMTLSSEGEASDGHILSIAGGTIPERMPMLASHFNEPTTQLGSIIEPQKALKDTPPRLKAVGQIEMSGTGASADIRRDLAHMISKGHVTGVSIRWDEVPGKSIRRVNLPSDHPYFVDAEKSNGPERWGFFFEEWRALEGSVVALGADPLALIGRAEETEGEVSHFWRSLAEGDAGVIAAALSRLRVESQACRHAGANVTDLINAVTVTGDDAENFGVVELDDEAIFLPRSLADQLSSRVAEAERNEPDLDLPEPDPEPAPREPDPEPEPQRVLATLDASEVLPPLDVEAFGRMLSAAVDAYEQRTLKTVQEMFALRVGKVS